MSKQSRAEGTSNKIKETQDQNVYKYKNTENKELLLDTVIYIKIQRVCLAQQYNTEKKAAESL